MFFISIQNVMHSIKFQAPNEKINFSIVSIERVKLRNLLQKAIKKTKKGNKS